MTSAAERHARIAELLGAFAIDAVDPEEEALVEAHLTECLRCRAEVDQLREVAAAVGNTSAPPSEELWDRIASHLGELRDPSAPPEPPEVARTSTTTGDLFGALVELPVSDDGTPVPSEKRRARRQSTRNGRSARANMEPVGRRRVWVVAGVGAAAACAALAVVFGVNWSNASGRVGQLQDALAQQGSRPAVEAALVSPGHQVVELRSSGGTRLAELVVRRSGAGYVVSSQMQALPGDETYQLWAEIAGQPISLGLLGAKPGMGDAFSLGSSATTARQLMVTVEPAGGVVTPDRSPVASASLD